MSVATSQAVSAASPSTISGGLHQPETSRNLDETGLSAQWLIERRVLMNLCLRWTSGNVSEAEDLLSDACLRILEHRGEALVGVGKTIGFWATVINNLGRDRARWTRRWKFDCLGDDVDSSTTLPAHTISAEQHVYSKQRLTSAIAKLACLSENKRKAVLLRCLGFEYSSIGEMLCTSEANARKLVESARRALNGSGKGVVRSVPAQRARGGASVIER